MIDYSVARTWFSRLIRTSVYGSYYFLCLALAWIIVAPDQAGALSAFHQDDWKTYLLYWGGFSGVYLSITGMASSCSNIGLLLNRRKWVAAFKSFIDWVMCLGLVWVPVGLFGQNLAIRKSSAPALLLLLVGFFLVAANCHRFRSVQVNRVLKETPHA